MRAFDMVFVDLSSEWQYTPGCRYLAINLVDLAHNVDRVEEEIEYYSKRRRGMVDHLQPYRDRLEKLYLHFHDTVDSTFSFKVHPRVVADILDDNPIVIAQCDRYGHIRADFWPCGVYAATLYFEFSLEGEGGHNTIKSFATQASRDHGVGSWENTPTAYLY